MKLFVIDWTKEDRSDLVDTCIKAGHEVAHEYKDGGEAYRKISDFMPDLILVNYAVKPSHGRLTVEAIKKRKKTASIPVYFIDGTVPENEKVKSLGEIVGMDKIVNLI
jgi:chemotaxis response regulator CheB